MEFEGLTCVLPIDFMISASICLLLEHCFHSLAYSLSALLYTPLCLPLSFLTFFFSFLWIAFSYYSRVYTCIFTITLNSTHAYLR